MALLQDHLTRSATARPDATAVVMWEDQLTYAALDRLSDRLAAALVAAGCESEDRVAILTPKRPAAIVAMYACLKVGAIHVVLDPDSPAIRLGRILGQIEPRFILAVPDVCAVLDELAGAGAPTGTIWSLEEPFEGASVGSEAARADWDVEAARPQIESAPSDPTHLIFTSGSTGDPKGVIVTHAGVGAAVDWGLAALGTEPDDRVSCHAPLHFDQSSADVYATIAAGAELHLVPPKVALDARSLAGWIRDSQLTQWTSVPAALIYMARFKAIEDGDFPALRRLLWGGEALPTPVLVELMGKLPHVSFTNLYGPTETTITSCAYTVPTVPSNESEPVPIGRACPGEEIFVMGEEGREADPGEIGEIYVGGVGVSPGYWRDPDKTGDAFVEDPRAPGSGNRVYRTGDLGRIDADGLAHFVGRVDTQVKSRGYRIELGEVESALASVAAVRECAVVVIDDAAFGGSAICAAVVLAEGAIRKELRDGLAALLPAYMIPTRWLELDDLPHTGNGKVDRAALRTRFSRPSA
jgi:amino acid adenylation domain-containing protein